MIEMKTPEIRFLKTIAPRMPATTAGSSTPISMPKETLSKGSQR